MKICGYCGSQLDDTAVACAYCGRVIVADGDPEAAKAQQAEQVRQAEQDMQAQQGGNAQGPGWQQAQQGGNAQGPGWQQAQQGGNAQGSGWQQAQQGGSAQSGSWQQDGNAQSGSWQQDGQQPYGGAPYGNQQTYGNSQPYGAQQPYGQQPYGQQPYGQQPYGQPNDWNRQQPYTEGKLNVCGLLSFIFGLVGIFFGAFYCLPCIAAVILGIIALVQHSKNPGVYRLKGFAIAGIVLGILTAVFWGAMIAISVRFIQNFVNSGGDLMDTQQLYDYIYQMFGGGFTLF